MLRNYEIPNIFSRFTIEGVWQFKDKNSMVLSFVTTFISQNFWDQDDFQFNPEHIHGWNAAVYRCKMGRYGTCQMF